MAFKKILEWTAVIENHWSEMGPAFWEAFNIQPQNSKYFKNKFMVDDSKIILNDF